MSFYFVAVLPVVFGSCLFSLCLIITCCVQGLRNHTSSSMSHRCVISCSFSRLCVFRMTRWRALQSCCCAWTQRWIHLLLHVTHIPPSLICLRLLLLQRWWRVQTVGLRFMIRCSDSEVLVLLQTEPSSAGVKLGFIVGHLKRINDLTFYFIFYYYVIIYLFITPA